MSAFDWSVVLWASILAPGVLAAGIAIYSGVIRKPRIVDAPFHDAIVLAAHPDDCVIVAGEYAIEAVRAGRRVDVVYFTCGDRDPKSSRARTRRAESVAVWTRIGVPSAQLHFLDLPESAVEGPLVSTPSERARARASIAAILRESSDEAVVFIPADGESHVDHMALRHEALEAVLASGCGRSVWEAPEYNAYYSLRYSPWKSLSYFVRSLPLGRRWWIEHLPRVAPAFACGRGEMRLRPDRNRVEAKKEMLRGFTSEDGNLLVKYFGFADRYRKVTDPRSAVNSTPGGYFQIGSRFLAPSVMMLWISVCGSAVLGFWTVARLIVRFLPA